MGTRTGKRASEEYWSWKSKADLLGKELGLAGKGDWKLGSRVVSLPGETEVRMTEMLG